MIHYSEWVNAIKKDIFKKYNIKNIDFFVNEKKIENKALEQWLKKFALHPDFHVKYKHLKNNLFELKQFSSNPPDKISNQIISEYLKKIPFSNKKTLFLLTHPGDERNTVLGDSLYNKNEIKRELLYLFRIGFSKISSYKDPTETPNEIIYHLLSSQESLENMLQSGYLKLEYFDDKSKKNKSALTKLTT